jgi:predicted small metal-binding protein
MAKVLRCNDLMPGCPFEAHGSSEDDVLAKAAEHAKTAHNLAEIPPAMLTQVRGAIRDESDTQA